MKVGIIGLGRMGQFHIELLAQHFPQHTVSHGFDTIINHDYLNERHITPCLALDDLLSADIDAVIISSPSPLHPEHIMASAMAGKAIFCEKPIGTELNKIEAALKVVEQQGSYLQIGFNRRFDDSFSLLQSRLHETLGQPEIIRICSRDPQCPSSDYLKNSGGIFLDMSIHDLDMARFLANDEVIEVYATGSCMINKELSELNDIDTAVIQLRFQNGTIAVIDNSRQASYGYDQRIEVFSHRACIEASNQHRDQLRMANEHGITQAPLKHFFTERYRNAYINQYHAFFNALNAGSVSPVSGFDGLQAVKLAHACQQAFQTRSVIHFDKPYTPATPASQAANQVTSSSIQS